MKRGIADGQLLRLKGKGNPGYSGGPAGDLLLTIHVAANPRYERRGADLYIDEPVNSLLAVTGGKVRVDTFHKSIFLSIPPLTDAGKAFRLKGLGMPVYDREGMFGDTYVRVRLHTPQQLSGDDISAIEAILNRSTINHD